MHTDRSIMHETPSMPLWRLHREGHNATCEIVMLPRGYEGRFLFDGRFLYSYQFTRPDDAVAWAGEKEAQYRQEGWSSQA